MMSKNLSNSEIEYIISRLLDNANDTLEESKTKTEDDFLSGKRLAYYEMLDTIKNEFIVRDIDLKKYGLDINLEQFL